MRAVATASGAFDALTSSLPCKFSLQVSAYLRSTRSILDMMRLPIPLLFLSSLASALPKGDPAPQPRIANVSYWGSACPEGGFSVAIGPVNATTNIAPLTFTLAKFLPELGSFGSSLRMCDIVSHLSVDKGWKIMVNARGTYAQGKADLPENATMFLRSTYSFAEMAETEVSAVALPHSLLGY